MVMLSVGAEFEGMDVQGEAGVGQQSPQAGQIEVPGYLLPEHSTATTQTQQSALFSKKEPRHNVLMPGM